MVSFLDGPLAAAIYNGFKGKLLTGTLLRMENATGTDSHGDPVGAQEVSYACEGFEDTFSDFFRIQTGIPDTDVKIVFISGSMTTDPRKDDKVTFQRKDGAVTYQLRKVLEVDPAVATYTCQGFKI